MGVLVITTSMVGAQEIQVNRVPRVRLEDNVSMISISPVRPMKFRSAKTSTDTVYLNILIDSVSFTERNIGLYMYYPKNIDPTGSNLTIGYVNGNRDIFTPTYISFDDPYYNYVEYAVRGNVSKIKNLKFDYLKFEHIAQVVDIDEPRYFMDFLKNY